jgi:transmembrane 9 superfamily member 2/4
MLLWFGISLPLVFVGGFLGFRQEKMEKSKSVNRIPRQIPSQVWYMQPVFSILVGGVLPFGAVFIELYFILSSIWLHKYYFVFGFLFIVFFILILTCAEITIVMTYFQLCNADYKWWWRSFLTPASSSLYLFAYSIFYFATKLNNVTNITLMMAFFGYTTILCFFFFILTGSVGFFCTFWFVRTIYASIKVD